jgi:hypothetical protein
VDVIFNRQLIFQFLYSYELDIMLGLLKSRSYKCTIHYIDDVFTLNNSKFDDYVDLIELEIKYTTDITRSTYYLDLHIDNDSEGRVRAKLKDKRDDFNLT